MKYCYTLFAAFLFVNTLFASPRHRYALPKGERAAVLNTLLQQNQRLAAMKSTAGISTERVIAQSTRDNTLATLNDSVDLRYPTYGSSVYDYNTMLYPYNYPYNTTPMFNFAGMFSRPQVLFDTFRRWQVDPNTLVYGYYETALANYDASYNMTAYVDFFADSAINPNKLYSNTFTTANKISTAYCANYIGGIPDSSLKQFFTYNSSNKITKDSMYELHLGTWRMVSKTLYTYDVAGNLTQIDVYANMTDTSFTLPLIEQFQYINTYDVSNRLLTVLTNTYNGTSLAGDVKDTFAYTGTYAYNTSWKEYQYDPINGYWAPMFYMTKVIGTIGLPDTVNIKGFDSLLNSWIPQTMQVVSYNSSHDPDTLQDYEYNWTAFPATPDFTTVYYYATYVNALGTSLQQSVNDQTLVFPNPAHGSVNISGLPVASNTPLVLSLLNIQGQIVSKEFIRWSGSAAVSTSGLVPGMYYIQVQDERGGTIHRQAIIKQ